MTTSMLPGDTKDGSVPPATKPFDQKILVVDDDKDLLMMTTFYLKRSGYQVIQAGDGLEALEKAAQEKPAIILLDWMMPGMTGVETCRLLRQAHPRVFIILLTAMSQQENRIAGLEAGADEYLTKPFNLKELNLRIEGVFRRYFSAPPEIAPEIVTPPEVAPPEVASDLPKPSTGQIRAENRATASYITLAEQTAREGNKEQARELFVRVLKLDPGNTTALFWLASEADDPQQALVYLEKLAEIEPDNQEVGELLKTARQHCQELNQLISGSDFLSYWDNAEQSIKDRLQKGIDRRTSAIVNIGQLLITEGFITPEQLDTALALQQMFKRLGETRRIGEILLEYGYLSKEQLNAALSEQHSDFYSQFY